MQNIRRRNAETGQWYLRSSIGICIWVSTHITVCSLTNGVLGRRKCILYSTTLDSLIQYTSNASSELRFKSHINVQRTVTLWIRGISTSTWYWRNSTRYDVHRQFVMPMPSIFFWMQCLGKARWLDHSTYSNEKMKLCFTSTPLFLVWLSFPLLAALPCAYAPQWGYR